MQWATAPLQPALDTGADLALAYLALIESYQALALRHNSLVDWVGQQCMAPKP